MFTLNQDKQDINGTIAPSVGSVGWWWAEIHKDVI